MRCSSLVNVATLVALGVLSACGGGATATASAAQSAGLNWYGTCGDPVCSGYSGPFPGVPMCTTEKAGGACAAANAQCDPSSACNALLRCTDRDPKQQVGGCPISRAAYKEDIRYLSDAQRTSLHRQVIDLKLATYQYKDAGPNASRRLGFLIDDLTRSPDVSLSTLAINAERDQIDLYGYTSTLVVALQVQAQQIEGLRQEVTRLREAMGQGERKRH